MNFSERLKYEWNKSDNVLMRLIMINVVLYLVFSIIIIVAKFGSLPVLSDFATKVFYLPANLTDLAYRPWTIITYGFSHSLGDIFHIVFNMLILYWFGQIVVSEIGSNRLLGLYIWGILAGAVAFVMLFNLVPYFATFKDSAKLIGASAGVYAVVVAAGTLLPNVKMNLFIIGEVSLKWIAMSYVILSFISLAGGNAGGNMAHLGGALMGYIFVIQYKKGNDWSKPIVGFVSFFQNIFKRKPKMKAYKGGASSYKTDDSNSQKQARTKKTAEEQNTIDAILDKISASGYESLTQKEKQILFHASKK